MPRRLKNYRQPKAEARREQFADGSALVTYPDGSQMIVESDLASATLVSRTKGTANSNKSPPRGRK